jgi:hypothetical protein
VSVAVFRKPGMMEISAQSAPAFGVSQRCEPSHSLPSSGNEGPDRRHGARRRVLKSALIVFNGGHCTLGCQILDLSHTGAMVRPSDIFLCPGEFVLQPRVGAARDCEVVWRKNDKIGVRYI